MIDVNVRRDGIHVSGHAFYAEPGYDVVCAGVTTLANTLVESLEDLTEDIISWEVSSGNVVIHYRDLSEDGCLLVDSFFIGICQIADEFPGYVRIV